MKYFITGATGFIGGRITAMLIEQGHEVIALARNPTKAQDLLAMGATVVKGDIVDKDSMREPMAGVDGIYHIAAWYKVGARDNSMAHKINVQGTRNVLELMKELNIPKGVYTSTLAVFSDTHGKVPDETYRYDGEHVSEYDRTKWLAHYEVALPMIEDGLPLVIVMPGVVYGPGDQSDLRDTMVQFLKGQFPAAPDKTAMCWAHVDDIAQGHILAMEKGNAGESYIIAGPKHTFVDYLETVADIAGVAGPRFKLAPGMLKNMAGVMGVVEKVVSVPAAFSSEGLRASAGVTYLGDNSKAKRELDYNPRSLAEGLQETVAYEMAKLGKSVKAPQ